MKLALNHVKEGQEDIHEPSAIQNLRNSRFGGFKINVVL